MKETRKLIEGAMLAAIYLVVLLITIYIPLIGVVILWFLPLPIMIYVIRHGLKSGIFVWVIMLLSTFMIGGIALVPITTLFGIGGLVVGELYRKQKSGFAVLLGGSLTYISLILLLFLFSIIILDINPIYAVQETMRQSAENAKFMLQKLGQEDMSGLNQYDELVNILPKMTTFLIISAGVMFALFIQLISSPILKRLKLPVSFLPPFRKWRFPKAFLWYYLIVLLLLFISGEANSSLNLVAINLFPILEMIMAIQGLSFIYYYAHEKEWPSAVPITITVFIFILPGIMYLIRILGIIDLGFDLRGRVKKT